MPDTEEKQATLVTRYNMAECIGAQYGASVIVYHDKNGDGHVDPNDAFLTMGPPDAPFRFKDVIARWDGGKFVSSAAQGGGVDREGVRDMARIISRLAKDARSLADGIEAEVRNLAALAGDGE